MPVYEPNTYITPGYQGTLGFGFCTALGVKVGKPDSPVVSINGDGGFGFALNELATMAQHEIAADRRSSSTTPPTATSSRIQKEDLGGRQIASDLRNPDYVKLAEAFGVAGRRAETAGGSADGNRRVDQGRRADLDRGPGRPDAEPLACPRLAVTGSTARR